MLDRLFKSPKEKVLSVLKSKFAMMCKIVLCVKMYIDFFFFVCIKIVLRIESFDILPSHVLNQSFVSLLHACVLSLLSGCWLLAEDGYLLLYPDHL